MCDDIENVSIDENEPESIDDATNAVQEAIDELENAKSEAEGVDFPGMFG